MDEPCRCSSAQTMPTWPTPAAAGARQPPLVGAVEALVEGRSGTPEFDTYAVFDPKVGPPAGGHAALVAGQACGCACRRACCHLPLRGCVRPPRSQRPKPAKACQLAPTGRAWLIDPSALTAAAGPSHPPPTTHLQAPAGRAGLDRARGPFKESIVFMIGAGSYAERESLMAWAARSGVQGAGVCVGWRGGVGGWEGLLRGVLPAVEQGEQVLPG